ncbi:MAG: hypothetical protein RR744_10580, partial [Cellulosilyticaceae bacterium]
RGEVSGLKWQHIDFDEKTISIKESRTQAGSQIHEGETKTRSSKRKLKLCDELIELYRNRLVYFNH